MITASQTPRKCCSIPATLWKSLQASKAAKSGLSGPNPTPPSAFQFCHSNFVPLILLIFLISTFEELIKLEVPKRHLLEHLAPIQLMPLCKDTSSKFWHISFPSSFESQGRQVACSGWQHCLCYRPRAFPCVFVHVLCFMKFSSQSTFYHLTMVQEPDTCTTFWFFLVLIKR